MELVSLSDALGLKAFVKGLGVVESMLLLSLLSVTGEVKALRFRVFVGGLGATGGLGLTFLLLGVCICFGLGTKKSGAAHREKSVIFQRI